jgi:hypothetical protein
MTSFGIPPKRVEHALQSVDFNTLSGENVALRDFVGVPALEMTKKAKKLQRQNYHPQRRNNQINPFSGGNFSPSENNCVVCNGTFRIPDQMIAVRICSNRAEPACICNNCLDKKHSLMLNKGECKICGDEGFTHGGLQFCWNYKYYLNHYYALKNRVKELISLNNSASQSTSGKLKPYMNAGLAEPFAHAIVSGIDAEQVMDLWESDWWKQYPPDDPLVLFVLSGNITEAQGKYLNSIRSDHRRLFNAVLLEEVSIEWAQALLNCGFDSSPEAVEDVLDGGEPAIIARIRKLTIDKDTVPTTLSNVVGILPEEKPKMALAKRNITHPGMPPLPGLTTMETTITEHSPLESMREHRRTNKKFREDIMHRVMEDYGIKDGDAFLDYAMNFDLDDNGYLKKAEFVEAAKAFMAGMDKICPMCRTTNRPSYFRCMACNYTFN